MAQYNKDEIKFVDRNNDLFDVVMISDKDGNILSSSSAASNINISMGLLEGYSGINNVGTSNTISGSQTSSIWGVSDTIYPWSTVDSGGVVSISTTLANGAASTLDSGRYVQIYGLDVNFNPIQETISINGSTGTGTLVFHRINKMIFHDGPVLINQTQINAQINGTIVGRILIGVGMNSTLLYTVPAGYTAFLTQGTASCNAGGDASVRMFLRPHLGGFITGHVFEINGSGGQYFYPFTVPMMIPEKSDFDIRATARQNKTIVTCSYDLILVKNS